MTFAEAVADFPIDRINDFPQNVEYTPWMLLEHIRLTQIDILDFMRDPKYVEPEWPKDYWPKKSVKADKKMWEKTVSGYMKDLKDLVELVKDEKRDLNEKVKNGTGQTVLREIILVIDHNSYHIGEFAILRQIMSTWPKGHK